MIIKLIIGFTLAGILMGVEYLLCTKLENPLWGGIIPCMLLIATVVIFASGLIKLEWRNLFPFIILNTLFMSDWESGRKKYGELRKQEMAKMKAKDL